MSEQFHAWILAGNGPGDDADRRVGMGFVIGKRLVLTCAHVVASAIHPGSDAAQRAACEALASSEPEPSDVITVGFPFTDASNRRAYAARVIHWMPKQSPAQRELPDDVALLELQEDLPADVKPGVLLGRDLLPREPLGGFGITGDLRDGTPFGGAYGRPVVGREAFLAGALDDIAEQGCSGAAVLGDGDSEIVGMITSNQGRARGLFLAARDLLKLDFIASRIERPSFLGAMTGKPPAGHSLAKAEALEKQAGLGMRLSRRLYALDHVNVYQDVLGLAVDSPAPMIALCGGQSDDLAHCLQHRLQMTFRLRAERQTCADRSLLSAPDFPPLNLPEFTLAWPSRRLRLNQRLASLKGQLSDKLQADGDGRGPEVIRAALEEIPVCVYSSIELVADAICDEDQFLLMEWTRYLGEIGALAPRKALVHVICVLPPEGAPAPAADSFQSLIDEVSDKIGGETLLNQQLLLPLSPSKIQDWLERIGPAADLSDADIRSLTQEAVKYAHTPNPAQPPNPIRLGDIQRWLDSLP